MKRILILLCLAFSLPAFAQGEKPPESTSYDANDPKFREIAKEFRCPTCTGLSVLESDASFSVQIKEQVQEQINQGKNLEQITDYFTTRYGPWILREPPKAGFGAVGYAVPIALLILGPILIWVFVWRKNVVVDTHGVRHNEDILAEMHERLKEMKKGKAR